MERYVKNITLKEKYRDNSKYGNIIDLLFRKANTFEQEYNKDLAEFNLEEIKNYLTGIGCGNDNTLYAYVSAVRAYVNYYKEETGKDTSKWNEVTAEFTRSCLKTERGFRYITPSELNEIIEMIPNPMDQFIIRGLYEGLKGDYYEELWALKITDIDSISLIAKLPTGRKLKISQDLYKIALKSEDTDTYVSLKGGTNWMNYKMIGDKIIKYRPNSVKADNPPSQKVKIANRLFDLKKYTGREEINVNWLRKSGAIYMIKMEAIQLGIKEEDVIDHSVFNQIRERYGFRLATTRYKIVFKPFLNN